MTARAEPLRPNKEKAPLGFTGSERKCDASFTPAYIGSSGPDLMLERNPTFSLHTQGKDIQIPV